MKDYLLGVGVGGGGRSCIRHVMHDIPRPAMDARWSKPIDRKGLDWGLVGIACFAQASGCRNADLVMNPLR